MQFDMNLIARLLLAALLGGIIGTERESLNRPAGLRTHILVSTGSALAILINIRLFNNMGGVGSTDLSRIAAAVVSGIGFLGAGTILKEGASVRGLTTAASLWAVAIIGLASGAGYYDLAISTTLVVWFTLAIFSKIERAFLSKKHLTHLYIETESKPGQLAKITSVIGEHQVTIAKLDMHEHEEGLSLDLTIRPPRSFESDSMISELQMIESISDVSMENKDTP